MQLTPMQWHAMGVTSTHSFSAAQQTETLAKLCYDTPVKTHIKQAHHAQRVLQEMLVGS